MAQVDRTEMYGAHVTIFLPDDEHPPGERDDPDPDLVPVTGIVFDPAVTDLDADVAWDPNVNEVVDPDDYPSATINAVIPDDSTDFRENYYSDVDVRTSIVPAGDPKHPGSYEYVPGWPER